VSENDYIWVRCPGLMLTKRGEMPEGAEVTDLRVTEWQIEHLYNRNTALSLKNKLSDRDYDPQLPKQPDGQPYRFKETGEKNRKREAARYLQQRLLPTGANPFGLEVKCHET
jgi:hypothetical protein